MGFVKGGEHTDDHSRTGQGSGVVILAPKQATKGMQNQSTAIYWASARPFNKKQWLQG